MSIFGAFHIGRESLLAHQRALQTTSNNIANVNTPGYTRQRAVFSAIAPSRGAGGLPLGGGVEISEVQRIADAMLDAQVLREHQELGFDSRTEEGFSRIEGIFNELDGTGISSSLNNFFQSIQDLTSDPDDTTRRQAMVETALTLTEQIRDSDRRLAQLQGDSNQSLQNLVSEVNDLAAQIAKLNEQIFVAEGGGGAANALRDTRYAALTDLAEKIDFTYFERDDGQMAIFVGGGFLLVDASTAGQLDLRAQGTGPNPEFFDIYQNVGGAVAGPITSLITGGELGSLLETRDQTVPDFRAQLDEFAFTLSFRFNLIHSQGYGLNDAVQRNFFTDLTQVGGAAGGVSVDSAILSDPLRIAAAGALDGAAGAPGDNDNAEALAALETTRLTTFQVGDTPDGLTPPDYGATGGVRTISELYDSLAGNLGSRARSAQLAAQQQRNVLAEVEARRAALSGVSLDEEVTDLLRFQRAYQASARVISTIDALLQDLLSI